MKCSNCGNEFGTGTHCQHCGVDRVTGLANYNGYNNSGDSSGYNSSNFGGSPKTTVCYACSEIIPLGSTFCPVCGKKLLVTCPNCGHEYSSQYPVCSKCGTNRNQYLKKEKERKQKKVEEQARLERLQKQQQQKVIEENKENFRGCFTLLGYLGLFFGVMFILIGISEHGSENFRINQGKETMVYAMAAISIIAGVFFLKNKK